MTATRPPRQLEMPYFAGGDYRPALDQKRLASGFRRILELMADNRWRTLAEIAEATGVPEASASAHLRTARRPPTYAIVEKERTRSGGTYRYRLLFAANEHEYFAQTVTR